MKSPLRESCHLLSNNVPRYKSAGNPVTDPLLLVAAALMPTSHRRSTSNIPWAGCGALGQVPHCTISSYHWPEMTSPLAHRCSVQRQGQQFCKIPPPGQRLRGYTLPQRLRDILSNQQPGLCLLLLAMPSSVYVCTLSPTLVPQGSRAAYGLIRGGRGCSMPNSPC
jgi:hypothetical protein